MSSVPPEKMTPPTDVSTITHTEVENYVTHILKSTKPRPPITWSNLWSVLEWINVLILPMVPLFSLIGAYQTKLRWETALFAVVYYFYTGLGITAGYHRLWAHRCYNAGPFLEYFLAPSFAEGKYRGNRPRSDNDGGSV
ncbi:hypothetical protein C8R46DRAFT_1209225 [Mycena filopes]|nr:hypothetical protein C8R46DRAFT_1209225 [Mycena filopes]